MVALLYLSIIIPVVVYLIFSCIEIWVVYRLSRAKGQRSMLFVQMSTEITHTFLVFAYAQFMVSHAELLTKIGGKLYAPIALLMMSVLLRASYYLVLFYSTRAVSQESYRGLLATYILGVLSLIWALAIIVVGLFETNYTPDTTNVWLVTFIGLPALAVFLIPTTIVYKKALSSINK